MTAIAEDTE